MSLYGLLSPALILTWLIISAASIKSIKSIRSITSATLITAGSFCPGGKEMKMKTLYFECSMGAAGDMIMSALYEILGDQKGFLDKMNSLGIPGVHFEAQRAKSHGISGVHMDVTVNGRAEDKVLEECGHEHDHASHHHSTLNDIYEIIDNMPLPAEVRDNAKGVYYMIAEAEAQVHGSVTGGVHFHEVGTMDAVADVTGVCYALYLIKADMIVVSPIHVGSGTVKCAHGILPVPAPATAIILKDVPTYGGNVQGELCTPTGAALLKYFADAFGSMPDIIAHNIGYGIGTRDFGRASCVRIFEGESFDKSIETITCEMESIRRPSC